jgi:hypothetical protein
MIFVSDAHFCLENLMLKNIGDTILRTDAINCLTRGVIGITRQSPSNISKIATNRQFADWFTKLQFLNRFYKISFRNFFVQIIFYIELLINHTLYCLDLSPNVCPSLWSIDVEQALVPEQRHCFSTHGIEYVSTLLHTLQDSHSGKSSSDVIYFKTIIINIECDFALYL